jgi:hypothetical protein
MDAAPAESGGDASRGQAGVPRQRSQVPGGVRPPAADQAGRGAEGVVLGFDLHRPARAVQQSVAPLALRAERQATGALAPAVAAG